MTNVDDLVRIRIEEARRKIEAARKRRAELEAARRRGLAARHAAKLRNLAASAQVAPDETPTVGTPDSEDTDRCSPRAGAREADGPSLQTAHPASGDDAREVA